MTISKYYKNTFLITLINYLIVYYIYSNKFITAGNNRDIYFVLFIVLSIPYLINIITIIKKNKNFKMPILLLITYLNILFIYSSCSYLVSGDGAGFIFIFGLTYMYIPLLIGCFYDIITKQKDNNN